MTKRVETCDAPLLAAGEPGGAMHEGVREANEEPHLQVVVVGAGVMGTGIAQTLAVAGCQVTLVDRAAGQLEDAERSMVEGRYGFGRAVERGRLAPSAAEAARKRLAFTDSQAAYATADLIVESIPEDLGAKVELFAHLGTVKRESALLASNTSGLPVIAMAVASGHPEAVVGWHWASPAQVRPFAEIVRTPRTDARAVSAVVELARRCGKNPIVVLENPISWGFVANRVFRAALNEAQAILAEGLASEDQIDALVRDAYGWPAGPFAVLSGASSGWGDERRGSSDAILSSRSPDEGLSR
jgi:3-hydroxybutyryl-CoA dehydrogenase